MLIVTKITKKSKNTLENSNCLIKKTEITPPFQKKWFCSFAILAIRSLTRSLHAVQVPGDGTHRFSDIFPIRHTY